MSNILVKAYLIMNQSCHLPPAPRPGGTGLRRFLADRTHQTGAGLCITVSCNCDRVFQRIEAPVVSEPDSHHAKQVVACCIFHKSNRGLALFPLRNLRTPLAGTKHHNLIIFRVDLIPCLQNIKHGRRTQMIPTVQVLEETCHCGGYLEHGRCSLAYSGSR